MSSAHFLLCYDIRQPKRLAKVHRACRRYGTPYQYSVFHVQGQDTLDELLQALEEIIDHDLDDVRAYRIGSTAEINIIGEPISPDGVLFC